MGKKILMNLRLVLHPFLVGSKRFLLRMLRIGGIGFRLFSLPTKRIPVSDTRKFFSERAAAGYSYQTLGKEVIELEPAINSMGLHNFADNQYSYEHFLMRVPLGTYYHRHPSVITADGFQLAIASNHPELSQKDHVLFQTLNFPEIESFKGVGLVLSTANDTNYYHCLFQIPPKIWLLEQIGFDLQQIDWYLLEKSAAGFQDEIISSLGIDKNRLTDVRKHPHVRGEQLLVLPAFWKPEPWICKRLRDTFLNDQIPGHIDASRLYISRNKASYRRILNEPQLLEVLNRYGFKILQLEGLSIKEQAKIFQEADIVISAHGAALANTVFCEPGTMIIEFRHLDHFSDLGGVYEHLSSICELNHFTYLCEGEANEYGMKMKFYDLRVDVDSVERLLEGVFENENIAL